MLQLAEAADADDVACPECNAEIEEEIKRGDLINCPECDCRLEVLDVDPAHLTLYVPEIEKPQNNINGRVVGERRPVTNVDDDDVAVSHTGLNPIVPDLPSATAFLDNHTTDAVADSVQRKNAALRDHTAFRIIDSQVRNAFRKQELISKIKNPGDKINEIVQAIVRDNEAGKINTSAELRRRVQEDVQAVYDASPARAKALARLGEASSEEKPDIDLTSMLPHWRRHPGGGTQTSNAGLDPLIQMRSEIGTNRWGCQHPVQPELKIAGQLASVNNLLTMSAATLSKIPLTKSRSTGLARK